MEQEWQDTEHLLQHLRRELHEDVHNAGKRGKVASLRPSASTPDVRPAVSSGSMAEGLHRSVDDAGAGAMTEGAAAVGVINARHYMQHMAYVYALRHAVQQSIALTCMAVEHHSELMHRRRTLLQPWRH